MKEMRISFEILMISLLLTSSIMIGQEKLANGIEKRIDNIFSSYEGKPGCAIAVVKSGKTLFQKGYGLASLEYEIPVTTKTIFDTNAVAKQATAACVFLLEEEGKLSLDDPIQKFFPEFPEYAEGRITIKNLLYQTSGIRSYLAILFSQNRYFGDRIDNEDILKLVENQQNLNFKPGLRHDYSNSNYALLSNIIEKISGKKLAEYAKEKLFYPLNMMNTFFLDAPDKVIKNRALGYQQEGDEFVVNHFFNPSVIGDGGLYSNLEDLVKWNNNLSSGAVGGQGFVTKMTTSGILNSGADTGYAGGLYLRNHYDIEGLPSIRHSGEWAGFRSLYYKFLNQDTAFIIVSNNAETDVWGLLDQLTPHFLANDIAKAESLASSNTSQEVLREFKLRGKEMEKFTGNFYNKINGSLRGIEIENDKLFYKRLPNGPSSPLSILNATELVFEAASFIKLSFKGQSKKTMVFTVNNQDPVSFERYQSYAYSKTGLEEYENNYYNEDLDITYQIQIKENQLQLLVKGKELVVLTPFSQDMFREEHFGYIQFLRNSKGVINGFQREDNTFSNLKFHKLETSS